MPILEVEIVLRPGEILAADLSSSIANSASNVFGAPPGRTWVRLRTLDPERYAEDGGGQPPGVYPVFVSILKADLPPLDELAVEIAALTQAIAQVCDRPAQNVHIRYEPLARGRTAFGGRLV